MKKSLIALAVAAATGSAFAQSSVTVAGIIDQGFATVTQESKDGLKKTKGTQFADGGFAGSRIRFSGVENLGGGLQAVFWLEQGIQPSDPNGWNYRNGGNAPQLTAGAGSSSTGQNRQSYVGMKGGFGEIRAGYIYAAAYDLWTNNGHINGEFTGTVQAGGALGSRTRGAGYLSPSFGGVDFYITHGARGVDVYDLTSTENQVNGRKNSESKYTTGFARYRSGPLVAAAMYETETGSCTAAGANVNNVFGVAITPATCAASGFNSKFMGVLGEYDLKVAKANLIYGKREIQSIADLTTVDAKWTQVNVKVPFGAKWEGRVTYNTLTSDKLNANGSTSIANNDDVKGHLVGVNYKFSPRTILYGFYGSQKNTGAQADAVTLKETKTMVGLFHSF